MYFLTELDPNYTIKGSRDPLGFQVIWQAAGRRIIPYLSTVSGAVRDFQILCIAYALKKELNIIDQEFEHFFIRLEQLMAYTRFIYCNDASFNGIDRVRKKSDNNSFTISNNPNDQLLSNQKSYGIWGKYIRPFTDIALTEHTDFESVYLQKVRVNAALIKQAKALQRKPQDEGNTILKDELNHLSDLLNKPTGEEKDLLTKYLLQDKYEGEFLRIVQENDGFRGSINLYSLIDSLCSASNNEAFCTSLEHIRHTEKVLSPLTRIFRYLQTRSYWSYNDIETDEYISAWRTTPHISLLQEPCRSLSGLLQLSNIDLVKGVSQRNEEVTEWRNSAPWMRLTISGLEVNHYEGAGFNPDYNPETWSDNTYFLFTFVNLYQQLN